MAEYVWLEGRPLGYVAGGAVYRIHSDHLGAPQVLTDGDGAVAWSALYAPFGTVEESGVLAFNLRFPGQYHDRETGYYYNYFRTYDPSTGRYVESDPIGLAGGWNTYGYVGGNPVRYRDPLGLAICRYTIATGEMICWSNAYDDTSGPVYKGTFISGNNGENRACKNNPKYVYERNRGPIPEGFWRWTKGRTGKPNGRVLEPIDALADPVVQGGRNLFRSHSCGRRIGSKFVHSKLASAGFEVTDKDGTKRTTYCSEGCIVGTIEDTQALNRLIDGEPNSMLFVTGASGWVRWSDAPM